MNQDREPIQDDIHLPHHRNNFMQEIERKSDFPASYTLGVLGVSLFLVYMGCLDLHLTNMVGIVFPVYWTMKYFENKEPGEEKQWQTYWAIWFGFFFLDLIVPGILHRLPLFYFTKLCFLIWLFLPPFQGANFLYKKVFSHINLPIDLSPIYKIFDKLKIKLNGLIDSALVPTNEEGQPRPQEQEEEILEEEGKHEGKKEHLKTPEEIVKDIIGSSEHINTETSTGSHHERLNQTRAGKETKYPQFKSEFDNPEEEQHESRQNIVGNAKINTENIKTNLQNLKNQFSDSVDRIKDVKDNITHNVKENVDTFGGEHKRDLEKSQITSMRDSQNINQNLNQNLKGLKHIHTEEYQDTFTKTNAKEKPERPHSQTTYEKKEVFYQDLMNTNYQQGKKDVKDAKEKVSETYQDAKNKGQEYKERAQGATDQAKVEGEGFWEKTKNTASDVGHSIVEGVSSAYESAKGFVSGTNVEQRTDISTNKDLNLNKDINPNLKRDNLSSDVNRNLKK